jgi:hypothetical protein
MRARRKSESILSYGELFQRSNRQNLSKRQVQSSMRTSSYTHAVSNKQMDAFKKAAEKPAA